MSLRAALTLLPLAALPTVAFADAPVVVTDIAPIHGLVSRVMAGVGEPHLLVPPGASPHGYSLRPSDARALSEAQAVFWIGESLEPWLEEPIEQLAGQAQVTEFLAEEGTVTLQFRTSAVFGPSDVEDHDADHADHEAHDHDDHEEHEEAHDEHGHEGHNHEGVDPHAWLSPTNGKAWLSVIAENLAQVDPAHAAAYRANAEAGQAEIESVVTQVSASLPNPAPGFVVFHDAYQYFETSFGLTSLGAISLGDASDPSVARIAAVRDAVVAAKPACVFSEPQFNAGLVESVIADTPVHSLVIDPLGTDIPLGSDFYAALIAHIGKTFTACFAK
ncbi:zinc ABC transporter substrate-binding protein [Arenibacterium sp. LLYu02]|uniref:zinc ABC transporter substrate-binding protein n=1 Tax=Arenibacterium sp. LLYu02 TaxID=3404132 RepID=UPI003B21D607